MNIGLIINAKGKACLVHDAPFEAVPVWITYDIDTRGMKIIFDTGTNKMIDSPLSDEVHDHLMKIGKILLVRMEDNRPVEGYDTNFVKYKDGAYYEESAQAA